MTTFTLGDRATLMFWGRPVCEVTITKIDPRAIWATDDEGRAAHFAPDGTSTLYKDHANTHLQSLGDT